MFLFCKDETKNLLLHPHTFPLKNNHSVLHAKNVQSLFIRCNYALQKLDPVMIGIKITKMCFLPIDIHVHPQAAQLMIDRTVNHFC